jgi:hypothetical protein
VLRIRYWNRRIVGDILASNFNSQANYVQRGEFNQGLSVAIDAWSFIGFYRDRQK